LLNQDFQLVKSDKYKSKEDDADTALRILC